MKRMAVRVAAVLAVLVGLGFAASALLFGGSGAPVDGGSSKSPPGREGVAVEGDVRKGLPTVSVSRSAAVGYAAAPSAVKQQFAPATNASGGLLTSSRVSTVKVGGRVVGAVAVYSTKPGLAKSPMFQDQYVVQLMQAMDKSKTPPRFVRLNGRVVALADRSSLAGWFEGDRMVLVRRSGTSPDLAGLALGVIRQPSGR